MAGPYGLNADHLQSLRNVHSKEAVINIWSNIFKCLCMMKFPMIVFLYSPVGNGMYIIYVLLIVMTNYFLLSKIYCMLNLLL